MDFTRRVTAPATKPDPVLIVEDDRKTANLLAIYLEREGFKTLTARDGQQALALAREQPPMLVVLDLMLPKVDGWEVCRELRRFSDVPILMLTARDEATDRVVGLSLGADDYVSKPFSPLEVVARVKAILRRARPAAPKPKTLLIAHGLTLDLAKRQATLNGLPLSLTLLEYRLLEALMAAPGRVFTREELLNSLHPDGESVIDRVVDVHIGKLRQKIESDPSRPSLIETVRGLGYRFTESRH